MNPDYQSNLKLLAKFGVYSLIFGTVGYYLPLSNSIIKAIVVVNLFGCWLLSLLIQQKKVSIETKGRKIFIALVCLILFSIFPAYYYWNQSFSASLISTAPFLLYGFFLILLRLRVPKVDIHKLLLIIALISLCFFYIKVALPAFPIGRISDDPSRGDRVSVPGIIFTWYLYFYSLRKCIAKDPRNKLVNFIILLLCLGVFILQKGRSQLAVIVCLTLLFYIKHTKQVWYKYLWLVVMVIGVGLVQANSIKELANVTTAQMDSTNPDQHVREIGMYYYVFEFPIKGINFLIGNGIPSYGRSQYGKEAEAFAEETKIHLVDIGLVGLYNYWGLVGVGLYVYIFYYFIFRTTSVQYNHSKYFLAVLLGQSIVSAVPLYLPPISAIGLGCYLLKNN